MRRLSRSEWPGSWLGVGFGPGTWKRFIRHRLAFSGLVVLGVLSVVAIAAPIVSPYDPSSQDLLRPMEAPSREHLLGTDELGRDLLSRLMYGTRISLGVGIAAVLLEVFIGCLTGAIAGYYGGFVDNALMRLVDVMLPIPVLFLILILAAFIGPGIGTIILILAITGWMPVARLVRGTFLSLKQQEFVEAAVAMGASDFRIIARHLLPNSMAPVIVQATLDVAGVILTESGLSFLGFGVQPPTPSWGNMLTNAQNYLIAAPWIAMYPGVLILMTVLSFNFVGDGLRDALDPRMK